MRNDLAARLRAAALSDVHDPDVLIDAAVEIDYLMNRVLSLSRQVVDLAARSHDPDHSFR
jgi:hypothetical protein